MVVQRRQANLFEIVLALRSPRRLTGRLNRGEQQRHEHADDGDYN
jgi:hypothetical protein